MGILLSLLVLCSWNIFGNDFICVPYTALEVEFTKSQIVAAIPGTFFCAWYASQKHWLANNILGLAFCIQVWLLFLICKIHCNDFILKLASLLSFSIASRNCLEPFFIWHILPSQSYYGHIPSTSLMNFFMFSQVRVQQNLMLVCRTLFWTWFEKLS